MGSPQARVLYCLGSPLNTLLITPEAVSGLGTCHGAHLALIVPGYWDQPSLGAKPPLHYGFSFLT